MRAVLERSRPRPVTRPTPRAFGLAVPAAVAVLAGSETGVPAVAFAGWCGVGVLVAAGWFALRNLRDLETKRRLPARIFARERFTTRLFATKRGRGRSLFVILRDGTGPPERRRIGVDFTGAAARIRGGATVELRTAGRLARRGLAHFHTVVAESSFPFGWFRSTLDIDCPGEALVFPAIVPIPRRMLPSEQTHLAGSRYRRTERGHDEFAGLREYRPGDPPKLIHWRTSARLPDTFRVRELERTPSPIVTVRFDAVDVRERGSREAATRPRPTASFERAVTLAASLVLALHREGRPVRFVLRGTDLTTDDILPGSRNVDRVLARLALVEPVPEPDLAPLAGLRPGDGPSIVLRAAACHPRRRLDRILRFDGAVRS